VTDAHETLSAHGGARVRVPPPAVFFIATVLGVALHLFVHPLRLPLPTVVRLALGAALAAAATALVATTFGHFRRTGQDPAPWKPSPALIVEGPYRFSRNPMYLGVVCTQIALGVLLNQLWISALALPALAVVHVIAVRPEERYLRATFGDAYDAYCRRVRRYI